MKAHRNLIMICSALAALAVPTFANASSITIQAGDPQLPGVVSAEWRSPQGEDMGRDSAASISLAPGQAVLRADVSEIQPDGGQWVGGVDCFRVGPETGDFITPLKSTYAYSDPNGDGIFDAADYVTVRKLTNSPILPMEDDGWRIEYDWWRAQFGERARMLTTCGDVSSRAVPEPANLALILIGTLAIAAGRCGRSPKQ